MRFPLPHPLRAARARRALRYQTVGFTTAQTIFTWLETTPIKHQHTMTVKHEPRPPAPRPSRLTVVWAMQDGQELRQFVGLHGQTSWTEAVPQWVIDPQTRNGPPHTMRFEFGYEDGRSW